MAQTDEQYMRLALQLAEAASGQTSPNPSVGAVIVNDGEIVGLGSHLKAGEAHAEVHAIRQAGDRAKGAAVYVTLEPCSHYGKTPPCAELLIRSEVKRVVIACLDPNPKVAGNGADMLRRAGIEVEIGLEEADAKELNKTFMHVMQTKLPYITLKAAVTLDGKTAAATGDSKWITGEEARHDVHVQRARHDAILTGIGTVLHDNPHLTVRLPQGGKNPIRIVLDTHLRTPIDANVVDQNSETWIVCGRNAEAAAFLEKVPHVRIIQQETNEINLTALCLKLASEAVQSLYVEGGQTVHGAFLQERLVQECHWYIAPKLLGGSDAHPSVGGISPKRMAEALQLQFTDMLMLGEDVRLTAVPKGGKT